MSIERRSISMVCGADDGLLNELCRSAVVNGCGRVSTVAPSRDEEARGMDCWGCIVHSDGILRTVGARGCGMHNDASSSTLIILPCILSTGDRVRGKDGEVRRLD